MKTKLYALFINALLLFSACAAKEQSPVTYASAAETDKELTVFAKYTDDKIPGVQKFMDSTFKQNVSLAEGKETLADLDNLAKVKIKSADGILQIVYSKKDSTAKGYAAVKRFSNELAKELVH